MRIKYENSISKQGKERMKKNLENWKPIIVMIGCQVIYAGVTLSGRAALLQHFSSPIFVVYRQLSAFFFIAPFAFFSRRGIKGCGLDWKSFWQISLLAFIGVTLMQNIYFEGLYLASAAATSALCNLVPAITFLMAYLLGLEKVNLGRWRSLAKMVGTVLCVSGAGAMTLLKGPKLLNMAFPTNSINLGDNIHGGGNNTWILGCLFILGSTFCWSLWLILQAHVSGWYPDHVWLTTWTCLLAAIQSGIIAFWIHPNFNAWKLTSPLQLFACLYAGLTSAVTVFAQAWCIEKRGPLFSAMFNPLCTLIVTIFACLFMHEQLYTGSLIGGVGVIIGLYIVLWGKAKDHEEVNGRNHQIQTSMSCTLDLEHPLLS